MNEISVENLAELEKRYRTTVFIILAQIFFVLILTLIAFLGVFRVEVNSANLDFTTLWIGVLFIAVGTFILRRMFFNWERLKNIAILKGVSGVLATMQRNSVILGAMAEIVAVMGFLISIFSQNSGDMFRAAAISLVVFLINFPRKKIWKMVISNLGKL